MTQTAAFRGRFYYDPRQVVIFAARSLVILALASSVSLALILHTRTAISLIALLGLASLLVARPHVSIYLVIVSSFLAVPVGVPTGIPVGVHSILFYELLLVLAAAYAVIRLRTTALANGMALLCLIYLSIEIAAGLVGGNDPTALIADSRTMLSLLLAYIIASRLIGSPLLSRSVRLLRAVLWVSLALQLLATFTHAVSLVGTTGSTVLFTEGSSVTSGENASRFLTPATEISLAVTCGCVALVLTRRASLMSVSSYLLPATLIDFMSFSRNTLLAIFAVIIYALVVVHHPSITAGVIKLSAALGGLVSILVVASFFSSTLTLQTRAYVSRVVHGLSSSQLQTDPSVLYRNTENSYLLNSYHMAPLLGHGYGAMYRPAVGLPGAFTSMSGTYYAHEFYLWLLVKGGIVGALAWLIFAIGSVAYKMGRPRAHLVCATGGAVGLLAISVVAPMPLGSEQASCVAVGIALGIAAGWPRSLKSVIVATPTPRLVRSEFWVNPEGVG